ncbi:MAG: hypothetical protein V2A73_05885, partial [Pseudomonadota bacterium]
IDVIGASPDRRSAMVDYALAAAATAQRCLGAHGLAKVGVRLKLPADVQVTSDGWVAVPEETVRCVAEKLAVEARRRPGLQGEGEMRFGLVALAGGEQQCKDKDAVAAATPAPPIRP